jgi:hypothetical protein
MRTMKMVSFVLLFIAAMSVGVVLADSPHFISASDALSNTENLGDLVVSFKEAGLGTNASISYTAAADGTATYACINGGGNHPAASNKETVSGPITANGQFSSGKNGTISQSLTIEEPSPGTFSCPGGQTFVLADVSFKNVSITDTTNGVTESNLGDLSRVFCDINNLTKATIKNCAVPD